MNSTLVFFLYSTSTNIWTKHLFKIPRIAAPDAPSVENWYDIIYETFLMERNTFTMKLQENKSKEMWKMWKMYISPKRLSVV